MDKIFIYFRNPIIWCVLRKEKDEEGGVGDG